MKSKLAGMQAAQAALVCRAATAFLRQQRLVHDATLQRDAAAIPLVIAGDFNSLPFKRRSDAFDTGGRRRAAV
jgi:endonuclease/exonuclease/phosphatase family metal-dependent hydrolase